MYKGVSLLVHRRRNVAVAVSVAFTVTVTVAAIARHGHFIAAERIVC
jgi:hypothetical protein